MGGAGDPPAPVGDPPTETAPSNVAKDGPHWIEPSFPLRPASRRTEQAGRLCYQQTIPAVPFKSIRYFFTRLATASFISLK